jgi:hypothetical protein
MGKKLIEETKIPTKNRLRLLLITLGVCELSECFFANFRKYTDNAINITRPISLNKITIPWWALIYCAKKTEM